MRVDTIIKAVADKTFVNLPDNARQHSESLNVAYEMAQARIGVVKDQNAALTDTRRRNYFFNQGTC